MKRVLIGIFCLSICGVANAQSQKVVQQEPTKEQMAPKTTIKFKEETHDFGTVAEGPTAETDFEFTNTGKTPLVITEAHGSCGCTVPQWPKEPILPGKKGSIHVTYNTQGRLGPINKTVSITANTDPSPLILHIKGTVAGAGAGEQAK